MAPYLHHFFAMGLFGTNLHDNWCKFGIIAKKIAETHLLKVLFRTNVVGSIKALKKDIIKMHFLNNVILKELFYERKS